MIIKWPPNGQFRDAVTNVLTSWTDVFEVFDVDDDDDWSLVAMKRQNFYEKRQLQMFLGILTVSSSFFHFLTVLSHKTLVVDFFHKNVDILK